MKFINPTKNLAGAFSAASILLTALPSSVSAQTIQSSLKETIQGITVEDTTACFDEHQKKAAQLPPGETLEDYTERTAKNGARFLCYQGYEYALKKETANKRGVKSQETFGYFNYNQEAKEEVLKRGHEPLSGEELGKPSVQSCKIIFNGDTTRRPVLPAGISFEYVSNLGAFEELPDYQAKYRDRYPMFYTNNETMYGLSRVVFDGKEIVFDNLSHQSGGLPGTSDQTVGHIFDVVNHLTERVKNGKGLYLLHINAEWREPALSQDDVEATFFVADPHASGAVTKHGKIKEGTKDFVSNGATVPFDIEQHIVDMPDRDTVKRFLEFSKQVINTSCLKSGL